ncbi:MAG: Gfo/Idh/MocA family oxidoreductase [Anaerolineae bacterium]|jgi:predicted dehydrogenase|nr:Gfo/Idh/MocA family oxidoreductase [Anaerolineae bacterium]
MKPLKVLLAGLGVRGRHHAEVLTRSPRCTIVACADPNPAARERLQAQYGPFPGYASAEDALADLPEVDALVLANPPIGRESQLQAAAARGIPVLVEKPLALSLPEAQRLTDIAEAAGIPLMVGLNFRYLGVTQAVMQHLRDETVGRATFARFTYERYRDGHRPDLNKYPLTMDQPMLWEQSIHHFDLLRFVYGQEPVSVMCHTWNPPWSMYASDTNVAALFTFDSGMIVNYQGTWQSGWSEPHFEWRTDCTDGVISQRHQFGDLSYARRFETALTPVALPPHEQWITETGGLLAAFVDTVADGQPLQCSARDHLQSLAMVQACILSSREGRSVAIASVFA